VAEKCSSLAGFSLPIELIAVHTKSFALQLPELYALTQVSPILTIETPSRVAEIIRREERIDIPDRRFPFDVLRASHLVAARTTAGVSFSIWFADGSI
jgi:hypothetical protein